MPLFTHHIAWSSRFSYTEIQYDSEAEGELTDQRMAEWANQAAAMEIVAEQAGLTDREVKSDPSLPGIVDGAVRAGAVPASANQSAELCPDCGAEGTWKAVTKKDGSRSRVLECSNAQHTDFRGGKTFPHTIRWG